MQLTEHQSTALEYLLVKPENYQPECLYPLVILLHGFGSHMGDLVSLCPMIERNQYIYILPNAPIPMDLGYANTGFAWANLDDVDDTMEAAGKSLNIFLEELLLPYQLKKRKIALGGFSQGAMITYQFGLYRPDFFRGLFALSGKISGTLPSSPGKSSEKPQSIFVAHGRNDQIIPINDGRESVLSLENSGYKPEFHEYEMGHEITPEVVTDLSNWLITIFHPTP